MEGLPKLNFIQMIKDQNAQRVENVAQGSGCVTTTTGTNYELPPSDIFAAFEAVRAALNKCQQVVEDRVKLLESTQITISSSDWELENIKKELERLKEQVERKQGKQSIPLTPSDPNSSFPNWEPWVSPYVPQPNTNPWIVYCRGVA